MQFWHPGPCPDVVAGDALSHLERAKWRFEARFLHQEGLADLAEALALDPSLWEPWALRAKHGHGDAAWTLYCLDQAIDRHPSVDLLVQRGQFQSGFDRFTEAERDFSSALCSEPLHCSALQGRGLARAHLGDIDGAVADISTVCSHFTVSETMPYRLGVLQWIKGDFAAAHRLFMGSQFCVPEPMWVWGHVCQIAHGARTALQPAALLQRPPQRHRGVWVTQHQQAGPRWVEEGPAQPTVWLWDLLIDLFADRATPADVWEAAGAAIEAADAWRLPSLSDPAGVPAPSRFLQVWRCEAQFHCGMWYLSKGKYAQAVRAFEDAMRDDQSDALERLAAAAQLKRLRSRVDMDVMRPLALASAAPSGAIAGFVGLQMALPDLMPTDQGPALNLSGQCVGDDGLQALVSSPNMRFVTQLDLCGTDLTAAGMRAFRRSNDVRHIAVLALARNPIGDDGVRELLGGFTLPALRVLDLSHTGITDAGAQWLTEQPHLEFRQLSLGDTPLGFQVWLKLFERFPTALQIKASFRTPHLPAIDPQKRVCFSWQVARDGVDGGPSSRVELSFRMSTYLRCLWERLARNPPSNHAAVRREIDPIHALEASGIDSADPVHRIDGRDGGDGLWLVDQGHDPVSLRCPCCKLVHVRPEAAVGIATLDEGGWGGRRQYTCPKGHVIA